MGQLQIPDTLWKEKKIHLPRHLSTSLREELVARGLFEVACGPFIPDRELFGGSATEDAMQHFAHRFKTSAARVGFVALDPNGTFHPLSRDIVACVFDGSVTILDIPCGSGGGLLGFLCTVSELRRAGSLPRLPVCVSVLGGDCSSDAREIHDSMLGRVRGPLEETGIRLSWKHVDWDVTQPFSTAALMDEWIAGSVTAEEYLVFVSAFSGFADKHTDDVLLAVRDITVRLHNKRCLIAWIEPDMNQSRRFLPRLLERVTKLFTKSVETKSAGIAEEFEYVHPFTQEAIKGRARVVTIEKRKP